MTRDTGSCLAASLISMASTNERNQLSDNTRIIWCLWLQYERNAALKFRKTWWESHQRREWVHRGPPTSRFHCDLQNLDHLPTRVVLHKVSQTFQVCMVGMGRSYREREHSAWMDRVNEFTTGRRDDEFAARPREERVRNCTKIDRGIQHTVVMTISNHLLKTSRAGEGHYQMLL